MINGPNTIESLYKTLNFLQNTHQRHPIVHLWGWSMECAAYMHQYIMSSLVHIMAFCLFHPKPLPKPMGAYCWLDPWVQISVKYELKYNNFQSRKCNWKFHLQNCGHLLSGLNVSRSYLYPKPIIFILRDHFVYVPSQWETALQCINECNIFSHWLGTCTKWSLILYEIQWDLLSETGNVLLKTYKFCNLPGTVYKKKTKLILSVIKDHLPYETTKFECCLIQVSLYCVITDCVVRRVHCNWASFSFDDSDHNINGPSLCHIWIYNIFFMLGYIHRWYIHIDTTAQDIP